MGRACTTTASGRCTDSNGRRVMVHTCNRFNRHNAPHRCITCGHTWKTTTTKSGSARRRSGGEES